MSPRTRTGVSTAWEPADDLADRYALRPLSEPRGVWDAIQQELARVRAATGVAPEFTVIGEPRTLEPRASRELLHAAQECLSNIVAHARATMIRTGLIYGDDGVSLLVEDDGAGFDLARLDTLDAFPDEAPGPSGLLGLEIRTHEVGGTLRIESTEGWGTRIHAEVPYRTPRPFAHQAPRLRVLVVHDNAIVRAGLIRLLTLSSSGLEVVGEARGMSAAIDAYRLLSPAVVLADIAVENSDGAHLVSYLRAFDPFAIIVLLTGDPSDDRVREAARCGAHGFVRRDIEGRELIKAITQAAQGAPLQSGGWPATRTRSARLDAPRLTAREQEVRQLVEQGFQDKQIAASLSISIKTVEKHVGSVLRKTGARNRTVLASLARSTRSPGAIETDYFRD